MYYPPKEILYSSPSRGVQPFPTQPDKPYLSAFCTRLDTVTVGCAWVDNTDKRRTVAGEEEPRTRRLPPACPFGLVCASPACRQ